jgi:hypothetical protein
MVWLFRMATLTTYLLYVPFLPVSIIERGRPMYFHSPEARVASMTLTKENMKLAFNAEYRFPIINSF